MEGFVYGLYNPYMCCVKISVLLLYIRIFGTRKPFRIAVIAVMLLVIAFSIAAFFASIFNCIPLEKRWRHVPGSCINLAHLAVASCVINIVADLLIFLLPIWPVWKLQLPTRQKMSVSAVFAAGSL